MKNKKNTLIEHNFLSRSKFTQLIEETVLETKLGYMDSIVHICDENNIEIEDVIKFISPIIVNKIKGEAIDLNYLKKGNNLDSSFS